jgi:predicted HTH domain antitoxin
VKRPRTPCPICGAPMPANNMARHQRTHGDPRERLFVTLEEQARIVELYNQRRASLRSVAEAAFMSPTEVRRVLIANDVPLRPPGSAYQPRKITVDEELQRTHLYGLGLSLDEVAELVGRHREAVRESLRRAGVKLRPRGPNRRWERARRSAAGERRPMPAPRPVPPRAAERPQVAEGGDPA